MDSGPLLGVWNPDDYVKSSILNHRAADDNRSKNVYKNSEEMYNKTVMGHTLSFGYIIMTV